MNVSNWKILQLSEFKKYEFLQSFYLVILGYAVDGRTRHFTLVEKLNVCVRYV